ncbi:MAG: site-specific integrase [Chitinophagaceae bacterium]
MQNNFNYSDVTSKALEYLKENLFYKYVTLRHYRGRWLLLKEYMGSHKIGLLSSAVCKDFLHNFYKGRKHSDLSVNEKLIEKSVSVLSEFMQTGTIQRKIKITYLDGSIGILMKDFLAFKQSRRLSSLTIDKIESHLSSFNFWLSANSIFDISTIRQAHLISYIQSLDPNKNSLVHDTLINLRGFFNYLYNNDLITTDFTRFIPNNNYRNQSRLPSYYSEEEINQLLDSIDRGTRVGKRDYAILVLAACLGLRESDIARLKFENLHWDRNLIILRQYKTGKDLILPLLPAVGNAMLDYIQYGRPKSSEQYIFLLVTSPYLPIRSSTIAELVGRRFVNANLNTKDKKHGGHALRHSLVKELLGNKQALPVIMEVLGHKNLESTRHYIRIDTESLRQCALEVPMVDPLFYVQEKQNHFNQ